MQLSVGRMHFCHQKNKAILDKKIGLVRVFVHDEAPYTSVVGKFQKEIFPDHPADENIVDLHALIFDQENSRVRLYIHIYGLLCV